MRTALILLLLCASVGAEDAPKYYAQISTSQTLPQRLVPKLRDIARKLDGEVYASHPDKDGNCACSVSVKIRTQRTVAEVVQALQDLITATDVFKESSKFGANITLMRDNMLR